MLKKQKYQLEDYLAILQECFGDKCEIDIATNKVGQPSVRLRYHPGRLLSFEMFIFESGFAVSYKPNGKAKCYEYLTPKQAAAIAAMVLDWYK